MVRTHRSALVPWGQAVVAMFALTLAACHGNLPLRYGESLCDGQHACPEGKVCQDGLCVAGTDGGSTEEPMPDIGAWQNPTDPVDPAVTPFCRVDDQCATGELCVADQCLPDPCLGVDCPIGRECRVQCRPTSQSCDDVTCTDNAEHCLGGQCAPLCYLDPCEEGGCIAGTDNCTAGTCVNDTLCLLGRCVPTQIFTCNARFCATGDQCFYSCVDESPCVPNPCGSGWVCRPTTGDDYDCIEISCAGVTCPAGEICQGGTCLDPCLNVDCSLGGKAGCGTNEVCCDRICCPEYFLCSHGECVTPDVTCDPVCETDEYCLPDGCHCGPLTDLDTCTAAECCIGEACDDPCIPNICSANLTDRGCSPACDQEPPYTCRNLCNGVSCSPPLSCDLDTGTCRCDGEDCTSSQCCVVSGGGATIACVDACTPNPCLGNVNEKVCVRDCNQASGYRCIDPCASVTCSAQNPVCNHLNGACTCDGSGEICGSGECCNETISQCATPCSPNPCTTNPNYRCTVNCSVAGDRTCSNYCDSVNCTSTGSTCDPVDGVCKCGGVPCTGSVCCISNVCDDPCAPNPCLGNATEKQCVRNCAHPSGLGYTCVDPCLSVTCGPRNPVCNHVNGACTCDGASLVCGTTQCCDTGTCDTPCVPNPCTTNPNYRCTVDCAQSLDYACSNFCTGVTCTKPNTVCDPVDGVCKCGGVACSGTSVCCVSNVCDDPCSPNPCSTNPTNRECVRDCTQATGYRCENFCDGVTCAKPNTVCDPADGVCKCGGVACGGTDTCCISSVCDDPCSPNPCDANPTDKRCVRDCTLGSGYRCESYCTGVTCTNNLACNPSTGVCGCGSSYVSCPGPGNVCCGTFPASTCVANPCLNPCPPGYLCDSCVGCYDPDEGP